MKKVTMKYLGWSNVLIKGEKGDLIFDPFFRKAYGTKWSNIDDFSNVKVICISHGHHEHYQDAHILAKETGAMVVSSEEICEHLHQKHGVPRNQLKPVLPFDEVDIIDFKITAFDWHHRPIDYKKFFQGSIKAAYTFMFNNLALCPWKARYYGFAVKTSSDVCLLNMTEGMNPLFSNGELNVLQEQFKPDILIGGHQLEYEDDVARSIQHSKVKKGFLYHPHEMMFKAMKLHSNPISDVKNAIYKRTNDVELIFANPMEEIEMVIE